MSTDPDNQFIDRPLRSFGRIKSRAIKPKQAALFDTLLPDIAVPDPRAGPLDPAALMPRAKAVWLEIGFGGGEHLGEQAARHPDTLMSTRRATTSAACSMTRPPRSSPGC